MTFRLPKQAVPAIGQRVASRGAALKLHFDGSIRHNPGGPLAWGYAVTYGSDKLQAGRPLATGWGSAPACAEDLRATYTVNTAEYCGLLAGLRAVDAVYRVSADNPFGVTPRPGELSIFGDSQLVVMQVNGEWQCRHAHLQLLLTDVRRLLKRLRFAHKLDVDIRWVSRKLNGFADQLAGAGLKASDGSTFYKEHFHKGGDD